MYIMVKSWYPNHKAHEVAQRYLEMMQKYPDDESIGKPIIPVAVKTKKSGIVALSISEVKKGKLDAAYDFAVKRMVEFLDIEGYRYEIDFLLSVTEALKYIGM